jgi:hypothetical protein
LVRLNPQTPPGWDRSLWEDAAKEEFLSGIEIVNALPAWALALVVISICVCFSVGLQLLTRWRFGVDFLLSNQEVAGFKFAVVGVAYGVLLAFSLLPCGASLSEPNETATRKRSGSITCTATATTFLSKLDKRCGMPSSPTRSRCAIATGQ